MGLILSVSGLFYAGFIAGKKFINPKPSTDIDLSIFYESFHEIKNLLNTLDPFILSHGDSKVVTDYKKIEEIITFLNAYIKLMKLKEEEVDLNKTIQRVVERFEKISHEGIIFEINLDKRVGKIKGSTQQLETIFKNLIENSLEAMEEGRVRISTRKKRKTVEIVVEDEGKGIDEKTIEIIFEPFSSSKENHLGLGLFIVKNIVDSYNGKIEVSSKQGRGTSVKITLPL